MRAFDVTVIHEDMPTIVAKVQEDLIERMDPDFWDPQWKRFYDELVEFGDRIASLGDFIGDDNFTSGYRGAIEFLDEGVIALKVRNVMNTGLDLTDVDFVSPDSPANAASKRVEDGDLLLIRSGVGSVGRNTLITTAIDACITGDLYRVPIRGINLPSFRSSSRLYMVWCN